MDEIGEKDKLERGKERLREARISLGLTQEKMGSRVHLAKSTICRAERKKDTYFPREDVLKEYSRIFHKPLFYWKGEDASDQLARVKERIYTLEEETQLLSSKLESIREKVMLTKNELERLERETEN